MDDSNRKRDRKLINLDEQGGRNRGNPEDQVIRALVEARRKKHITQKQLAALTGITQPDISRLENGRGNPSLRRLHTLAKGLGMELRIEFVDVDPEEPSL